MSANPPDLTAMLNRWRAGETAARDELLLAVYPLLRSMAQQQLGRDSEHFTLRPTELAHEAFLRMQGQQQAWQNREHFQAIVATVLRRVVIDYLRRRSQLKRGGDRPFVPLHELDESEAPVIDDSVDWLRVEVALNALEEQDPALAQVVELKFYSGLKTEEIALVTASSVATVGRRWRFAKAWLAEQLAS